MVAMLVVRHHSSSAISFPSPPAKVLAVLYINNELFLPYVTQRIFHNSSMVSYGVGVYLSPGFSTGVVIQLLPSLVEYRADAIGSFP